MEKVQGIHIKKLLNINKNKKFLNHNSINIKQNENIIN
jgi:hypothetical protein